MNTQRKVVITTTYNEMGIIIDTKAEEVAQPDTTTHDSIPAETGKNDQATCEYCHEDSDGYVLSIEKNGHAYIQNGKLALRANGWWGECNIEYCPMCGRKLRGDKHETD